MKKVITVFLVTLLSILPSLLVSSHFASNISRYVNHTCLGFDLTSGEIDPMSRNGDTIPPTVNAFSVNPDSITLGKPFTISYTVSDTGGSGLNRVELWRKSDIEGWKEITRSSIADVGDDPYNGSFSDTPSLTGTYLYGMHVVDNAGNWNDETNSNTGGSPGVYGPIEVTVKQVPPPPNPPPGETSRNDSGPYDAMGPGVITCLLYTSDAADE